MEPPTLDNFVSFEKIDKPDKYGRCNIYELWGVQNASQKNSIYLWRNYNTFDTEPTLIPDGFVLKHSGYEDCDECNKLNHCCPNHIKGKTNFLQQYRFGSKVFAEDYIPVTDDGLRPRAKGVDCASESEIIFTHDNGGRPFKAHIDHEQKKIHIYSLNRNIIFSSKTDRKDYTHSNMVCFRSPTQFQLAMNSTPEEENISLDEEEKSENVNCEDEKSENVSSEESSDEEMNTSLKSEKENYYDQHIGSYSYEKIWIPDGLYLKRNKGNDDVVQDKSKFFYGNSILCYLGKEGTRNKYLSIGCSVDEFTTNDEIQRYYSLVGNSDVPYPVAVGKEHIFFMAEGVEIQPLEKYSTLTEDQLADAYSYYYGNKCFLCDKSECKCPKSKNDGDNSDENDENDGDDGDDENDENDENDNLSVKTICKRDF